jgi:phage shock protein C
MARDGLTRPRRGRIIAGVCAGIADAYGWKRGTVRLVFALFGLFGAGELAYIVLWILMPKQR